ncbi:MAG: DnaD domain protein [Oscillospiraceae bacterium]|nr:DnaD domain protein [Oscillospiraceae bacterium]
MKHRVNFGFHAFAVPSAVVDNLIKFADETKLKVLLYLLRYPDQDCSPAQTANYLNLSEEHVQEAFEWWMQANILQDASLPEPDYIKANFPFSVPGFSTGIPVKISPVMPEKIFEENSQENLSQNFLENFSKIQTASPRNISSQQEKTENRKIQLSKNTSEELAGMSNRDITDMILQSAALQKLVLDAQNYFRRDPNAMQLRSLVWMHEYLGLQSAVILILLEYCTSIQKIHSTKYIDKIAYSWWNDEILTEEEAKRQVAYLLEFHSYVDYIRRLFEMDAKPTSNQKELIEQWQQAGHPEELLQYAHDLTVEAVGKVNFKYIDKILFNWSKNNITTRKQAQREHDAFIKKLSEKGKSGIRSGNRKISKNSQMPKEELESYLRLGMRFIEEET